MKYIFTLFIIFGIHNLSYSQCSPNQDVIDLGDPENDGVLNPHYLEVHAGEEINLTVTVLSPPGGEGEIGGFINVPYTMNYFIVQRLDNMPSWVSYECPDDCKFNVDEYSCVLVTGTAPNEVPVGDSTVMNVIVDANVDASWGFLTWNDYTVEDEDGGTLSIRYVENPSSSFEDIIYKNIIFYNDIISVNTDIERISVYNMFGTLIKSGVNNSNISIANQPKGIYVIIVNKDGKSVTRKIIKH